MIVNKKYNFIAELTLKRSRILDSQCQPKDDKVNWLFLCVDEKQYSFVYKIKNIHAAEYNKPFKALLAFTMIESVKDILKTNHSYEVLRGQEVIGTAKILEVLLN